jgi:DNA polymerase-3 subunit epsilon
MKQIFIDVETTGLSLKKSKVKELGFIYFLNGKKIRSENIVYKDENSIYNAFLFFLNSVIDPYDPDDKAYFIAYNSSFDFEIVRNMFLRQKNKFFNSYFKSHSICVMHRALYVNMTKNLNISSFKLGEVCKFFKIGVDNTKLHGALYDIELTYKLYKKLQKK